MGRTPASEVLSKLNKALSEVYAEAADKSFEITLLPIDLNSTNTLGVSVLVVALRDRQNPEAGVAHHTLVVEASIEQPAPRFEVINGVNTEIIRTVGEAYDPIMQQTVAEAINRAFSQTRQLAASAEVVPRDFNITDSASLFALAANAVFACSSELETSNPDFKDLNLVHADRDSNLTVRTTFGNPQSRNAVGQPIRSDVLIEFSAAPLSQGAAQQTQAVERTSSVARIAGFMDLVWDPAQMQQNYMYQNTSNFQRYAARFVSTALESTQLLTIGAQLLALIPALSLRENNQWVQAFRRQSFSNKIDMHDIGAIGIEANFENNPNGVGTRIDTQSDSFKPEHLHKLIASTIKPGLILSLDVPECGPETWYNDVFAAAAENNPRANAAIINAAMQLTNGAFAKYFPNNGQVAIDENNRIHMGHYSDSTGVRKDIRDFDYLAVMNLVGEKDPQIIRDWSDTFLRTQYPLPLRMARRKQIIAALCGDVVFTGFARRVTFTPEFIGALEKACSDVGLAIRSVSSYADMGSYDRAISGSVASSMLSGDAGSLFNRGNFNNNAQQFGAARSMFTRSNW
jgi:hypothetical protein